MRIDMGNMPHILGPDDFAIETRTRVNGRRFDAAAPVDAANSAAVPAARAQTGLASNTRIATPNGQRSLGELASGDLVHDAHGNTAMVQHILRSPVVRSAIRMRAPYFGLNQDVVIGAQHRIAITSEAAEYLFGVETILVPAWALKDGIRAQQWDLGKGCALYQVQLDRASPLQVGGCAIGSLPKAGQAIGKMLSDAEARCFATEYRQGIYS